MPSAVESPETNMRPRRSDMMAGDGTPIEGNARPVRAALALVLAVFAGTVVGWAVEFPVGIFLTPPLALACGLAIGEALSRAAGRGRARQLRPAMAALLVSGALGGRILVAWYLLLKATSIRPPFGAFYVLADLVTPSPLPLIALALVLVGVVLRRPHGS